MFFSLFELSNIFSDIGALKWNKGTEHIILYVNENIRRKPKKEVDS